MVKYCLLSVLVLSLFFSDAMSQTIAYTGKVVDEKGEVIPFAHIRVSGHPYGTIGNLDGSFRLVLPKTIDLPTLIISAVGFETHEAVALQETTTYVLREDVILLDAVVVVPVDYARELIMKASSAIPNNYPQQDEMLTGFYRERSYWNDAWDDPIYVIEMVNEVRKESYERKNEEGQLQLIQGRRYESSQMDSLATRFYAGPHIPHRFDIVAARHPLFKAPKSYSFELTDTTRYLGKNLFEVSVSKNHNPEGKLYIHDSTFAIVKANLRSTKFFDPFDRDRTFIDYTIEYEVSDDERWRVAKVVYKTSFDRKQGALNIHDEFITTAYRSTDTDIDYVDQLQFRDIALDETGEYNDSYWDNYTIALPDESTQRLFEQEPEATIDEALFSEKEPSVKSGGTKKPFGIRVLEFLRRLEGSYGVMYTPIDIQPYTISYSGDSFSLEEPVTGRVVSGWSLSSEISYRLNEKFLIGYRVTSKISNDHVAEISFRAQYKFNLNPKGRPIMLSPILTSGLWSRRHHVATADLSGGERIAGKKLDARKTQIFSETRHNHITPELRLEVERNRIMSFYAGILYPIALNTKNGLYFQENSGFLFGRRSVFLEEGNEGLVLSGRTSTQQFSLNLGVLFHF